LPAGRWRLEQTSRAFSHLERVLLGPVVDFSGGKKSELKTWALDGSFDLPTSQTEILKISINFVDSALGQTQGYDSERDQDLLAKAILRVNLNLIYILTLAYTQNRATTLQEIHWLHQERSSYYFPMNSSTDKLE